MLWRADGPRTRSAVEPSGDCDGEKLADPLVSVVLVMRGLPIFSIN